MQRDFAEALEQLAVFQPKGRDAILADPTAMEALQEVAERGWSEEARECAAGALSALSDRDRGAMGGGDGAGAGGEVDEERRHIMMSCEYLPAYTILYLYRLYLLVDSDTARDLRTACLHNSLIACLCRRLFDRT